MILHSTFTDVQFISYSLIVHSNRKKFQHFEFSLRQFFNLLTVHIPVNHFCIQYRNQTRLYVIFSINNR